MSNVTDKLNAVLQRIRDAEIRYSRPEGSVTLVAVSKRQPLSSVLEARQAGHVDFAENYVQEGVLKVAKAADPRLIWHFIGHIQSNKCRDVAANFDWVHSVDREKIAQRLSDQRSGQRQELNICLQVNLQSEDSKSGLAPHDVGAVARRVSQLPRIRLRGLMAIPAPSVDFEEQRAVFRRLADLMQSVNDSGLALDVLSMGMTNDLEAAIAAGATHVRIGTAVFGTRDS